MGLPRDTVMQVAGRGEFDDMIGQKKAGDGRESNPRTLIVRQGLAGKMAEDPLFSLLLSTISKLLEKFEEGQPFVTKTVKELLFEGYYMPFFDNLTAVLDAFGLNSEEIWDAHLPPDMRDFRFAFYRMNETVDGPYLVGTGEEDPSDFGRIHLWHGRPYVFNEPWGSHECNAINGTDGTVFPPSIDKEDIIYTFVLHLSIHFKYEKDVEVGGHLGYRFVIHPDAVASTDVRPENECFCVNGECLGAGLLDVSASVYGKPVIMSSPHFYVPEGAGETGFNASLIHGISPNKDSHETFIVVEPSAGFILEARRRLQTSIKVRSIDGYRTFENFPAMELPAFWMEEVREV
ncbi:unnamed protein product [Darwinula stevensoni]|uniref:Uncharacterized protein n=1 Tax=Darwinula stevensoni TaxID=69355 RepID=A0A7R9ABR0_9CRUS|nr:unnamed protein product [Darwinula stevensoni]CAG0899296.1 unnamed protein product [Darwinula stevensoni]